MWIVKLVLYLVILQTSNAWRLEKYSIATCIDIPNAPSATELCLGEDGPLACICMVSDKGDVSSRPPFPSVLPGTVELQCLYASSQALYPLDRFMLVQKEACEARCKCESIKGKRPVMRDPQTEIVPDPSYYGNSNPQPGVGSSKAGALGSQQAEGSSTIPISPFARYGASLQRQCEAPCQSMETCKRRSGLRYCADDLICLVKGRLNDIFMLAGTCVMATAARTRWTTGLLGGRNLESALCKCNQSYVSTGCCAAKDGIVWEEKTANMLRLDL